MFLRPADGVDGVIAIPQASHAWLAWQAAEHWGNRRFARPAPRAEVLAAVLLHDVGWTDFDTDPGIDGDGRPRTFDRMEVEAHLRVWRSSVGRVALHCRYAALLVAAHCSALAERKLSDLRARGDEAAIPEVDALCDQLAQLQRVWRQALAGDPRYQRALDGPGWTANLALLRACDRLGVSLCAGWPPPFEVQAAAPTGELVEVSCVARGEGSIVVRPWPFQGERVRLQCEGRRLSSSRFASADELRGELSRAPTERLGFTLVRPAARS